MTAALTPTDWEYVSGVVSAPVVERTLPSVKRDEYVVLIDGTDSGRTYESRVLLVDRL